VRARSKPNPLGQLLDQQVAKRGLTHAAFCRLVGLKRGTLSAIRLRRPTKVPKTIDVDAWAKALGLKAKERDALRRAAELAWSPQGIQDELSDP
jgi:hypothetical protein